MATNIMGAGNYFGNGLTFNARSLANNGYGGDTILQGNYGIGPLTANINADGNSQILGNYFDQQINPMWFPYAGQPTPQPQPQYYNTQPVAYQIPYSTPNYGTPSYGAPSYGAPSYGSSYPTYNMPPVSYQAPQSYAASTSSAVAGPGGYGSGIAGYPSIYG